MSTEGTASFVSHQAIVKFTLLDKSNNNAAISPSSLTVNYGTGRVSLTEIPAATYTTTEPVSFLSPCPRSKERP